MPLNSFDDAIDQLAKDGDIETGVAPKNPYDDAIDSYIGSTASAVQNSAWVAKDKDPVRTAKVLEISKREGYDPSFVERNFDTLSKAGTTEDQYKRLAERAPGLARWMEKPEYAAISRGDEANLAELENQLSSMTKEKPKESWFYLPSEMAEQARAGFYDMNIGANLNLGLFGDPAQRKTVAKAIASDFQKQASFSGNEPSYLQEFRRVAQDQAGDMGLAYYRAVNGWREMRAGMWLQGLQDLSFGATMTLGEGVEFLKLLAHPRGLMTEGARVFASSAPAALGGLAGSVAGPLGVAGGVAAGTTMISTSGRAMEILRNQGVDFSSEESILSALNDDKLMAKVRSDAFRGGFAEGLVSGAFAGVSGSKVANALSGTAGKVSKMQVAKSAVLEAVKEMGGETVEGLGGDIAQSKGDLASVDLAQNVMEGVLSLGSSGTTVAAGTISRGADMALIKARSYEVSKKVDLAMSAIDDAQRMEVASLVLEDSKTNQLSPDSVKEFMASVGGPDGKVFFQSRDWDAYFKKQNVSPVEALEAISPSAALKYTEKVTTGGAIEIPVADFLSNVYNTPHKKELIKIMRSTPGSMSLAESVEAFKTLPDDVKNVLSDAMFLRDNPVRAESQTETDAKISEFESRVTEDLVQSGDNRSKARDRAKIFGSMVRAMSSRSTFSVDEIISKYGFNVSRGTSEVSADGQTYDQPGYHGSPEGKSELKAVEINNADGSKSFGWGIYFSAKKALAEFYRKERAVEGKKSSLLTYDIPEDNELLDRDKKISEQSEQVRAALPDAKPDETGGEYYDRIARKLTPEMASRTLASKGVKGLRYNDTTAKMAIGEDATNFVVFDDKFINQMDKVFYQKQSAPTFFSQIQRTIDEKIQGKSATVEQIRAITKILKPEEVKWSGIEDFLRGKAKVDKAELMDYLRANELQVEEVVKGDDAQNSEGKAEPKFSNYQLPGGENYRELLLRMPENAPQYTLTKEEALRRTGESVFAEDGVGPLSHDYLQQNYPDTARFRVAGKTGVPNNFRSPHFEELNILAHVRFNDRVDADGKRVLFLEEIQSDWHQKGRKEGYRDRGPKDITVGFREDDLQFFAYDKETGETLAEVGKGVVSTREDAEAYLKREINRKVLERGRMVPDAPFRKTWHEFALKRMIRYAAENGYDKVAWTTGEQQADRYDLSKQVDKINWNKKSDGSIHIAIHPKNARAITKQLSADELPDFIGKEASEKILSGDQHGVLEGVDLKVGGEGMKGFYDQIIPKAAEKIAGKLDKSAKVSKEKIVGIGDVHTLELTEPIRDAALSQGFSLFQENRGRITIRPDRTMDIELLAKADDSTFFHEMGHAFLEVMADIAELEDSDAQVKEDFEGLLKWLGVESRDQIGTEQHEQFARGFEAFLMEGKSPSMRLRNVFYRAQMWLINVYKKLVELNVELTPEVRNIMGRMIATEEELTRVAEAKKTKALFSGIETFGLPQHKVERYVTAIQDSESQAVQIFNAKMFENYRQEKRRFLDKERKRIKGELESKYEKTQGAMAYKSVTGSKDLPEGARNIKLDRKSYTEAFGKEAADALPKKAFGSGGFRPDEAAAILGFRSGKQLSEALTAESNRSQMIDFETEAMLANEYGDLMAQADMSDEAYEALQNDSRTKLLELELDMLATDNLPVFKDMVKEITNRPSITARDVKDYVDAALGETSLRDISPRKFEIAENKSATEAGKALTAGDRDAAYLAHKNTLIQHQFYKRAIEIRSEVEKAQRDFQKIFKSDEDMAKTKDLDYVNAARALLASVGMGQAEKSPAEYLEQTKSYDPDTYETMASLLNATITDVAGKDFKDLTYDQFYSLKTATNALMEMARETRKVSLGGERQSIEDVSKALSEQVQKNIPKPKGDRKNTTVTDADKLSIAYSSVKAGLRIMGSMADEVDRGDQLGIFNKVFVREVKNSLNEYRSAKKDVLSRFDAILKEIAPTMTTDEIEATELKDSDGNPFVFQGRAELIGALLHVGNESNFRKLLVGRKWGSVEEDGVTLNRSKWDAFIKRMHQEGKITKADWDAVQKIWDLFEELKPGVQRAHKRLYGHYFSEITAAPVATPFGQYRGGYFPARSDPFEVDRAATYEMKEMMESNASYAFPTAGRGATKSRIERYAAPLSLNLRLTLAHADWALRFAHLEPTVKELGRLVQNDSFRIALNERLPQAARDVIMPYLQRVVTQRVTRPSGDSQASKVIDRALTTVRRNAAFGVMFGNFANAAQQFTGLSVASAYKIDGKRIGRGLLKSSVDYVKNPKTMANFVASKSKEMEHRMISQAVEMQRRIDEYLLNPSKFQKAKDYAYQNAYVLQSATQNVVDTITWTAAYSKAMEKKGRSESDAIFIADKAVITTQGSSNPEDISQFISGTPVLRAILMFQNYNNIIGNYLVTETRNTMRDLGVKNKYADLFTLYALVLLVPAALSGALKKAASGKLDEDDDDEYLDDAVDVMLGEPARQALGFVPFVGQGLEATVNRFDNKWYNDQIRMSPVIDTLINKAPGVPRTIGKAFTSEEIKKRDITDAISVINALIGVPIGPLSRPIGYAYSVSEGKTEPANAADFVRGLVVGR